MYYFQVPKTAYQNPLPTTSRMDFKRLLLQQSVKTGPTRLSAAEQLKLSRQQSQQQQHQIMLNQQQHNQQVQHLIPQPVTPSKVLSPRAAWRFQSPRSDVLSSTIIEDAAAEEKAMKPSPENTSPLSKSSKRQLDLRCEESGSKNVPNSSITDYLTPKRRPDNRQMIRFEETDNRKTDFSNVSNSSVNETVESRRINNQLARAQFLASFPGSQPVENQNKTNYFTRHNRARSESPQHGITQNVSRSPSAPTLETAL